MRKKKRFLINGTEFYNGKPCIHCGGRLRYGSTGGCHRCNADKIDAWRQRQEEAQIDQLFREAAD